VGVGVCGGRGVGVGVKRGGAGAESVSYFMSVCTSAYVCVHAEMLH